MFRNGVSSRRVPGNRSPTGTWVLGSRAKPGAGRLTVSIRISDRRLAPTTAPAAMYGQRSFWKYVSTPIAMARTRAAIRYRMGAEPEPGYWYLAWVRNVNKPARNRLTAKV